MKKLEDHPTVKKYREKKLEPESKPEPLDANWLRKIMLEFGADDVGFVEIDRPEIADQKDEILAVFPKAKSLISFVCKLNREPIRTPARSISNIEFHHTGEHINEIGRKMVGLLESKGIGAINPAMGFPMEMDRFPEKMWVVSHKPVAEAAGLGVMGIHRNLIHPKFGNFILLGTIIIDAEVSDYNTQIDFNPCLECKLCVAACPVGAIGSDGHFNFSACYFHNYREFMGGFTDWVETIADSKNAVRYRNKINDAETSSMWQSLSFGANYKAAYCLSVCPAGEDIIGTYLENKKEHIENVVKPLQNKIEPVYVVPGSDAEDHVKTRFPNKIPRKIKGTLRADSVDIFLKYVPVLFQRNQSTGLDAVYHFTFTGKENRKATIVIKDKKLAISEGHVGKANFAMKADSETWIKFLKKEKSIVTALLSRKIKIKGSPKLLLEFAKCFPS